MEIKRTPGPWTFDGENVEAQGFDVALPDGGIVATAYYDTDRNIYSVNEARMNAHLIAATPELLEVCESAPDPDQLGIAGVEAFAAHYQEWCEQLRKVIAKAEGHQP